MFCFDALFGGLVYLVWLFGICVYCDCVLAGVLYLIVAGVWWWIDCCLCLVFWLVVPGLLFGGRFWFGCLG